MKCARRQQGRSWEVVEAEIAALGGAQEIGLFAAALTCSQTCVTAQSYTRVFASGAHVASTVTSLSP